MAMYAGPERACVEFLKATGGVGQGRAIRLAGVNPGMVPPQLYGPVDPPFWDSFMREVQVCADHHPYLVKPSASDLGRWASCGIIGAFLGFCCVDPDSGNYGAWHQEVNGLVNRWQPFFQQRGLNLSFHTSRHITWLQVDVVSRGKTATGYPA